jgi:predicted nucleic acid-binding protein
MVNTGGLDSRGAVRDFEDSRGVLVSDEKPTNYMVNQPEVSGPSNSQGLWKKGVLVQLQGGVWSMEARLQADDLNMDSGSIPEFATLGKKRLLDAKHKNEFLGIINKARGAAERLGFRFLLTGSYFIPFSNFDRFRELVDSMQKDFYRRADSFVETYSEKRVEYLERYAAYWDRLEPYYPEPAVVRGKFRFSAIYYAATMSSVISPDAAAEDIYLTWAVQAMNILRSEARDVATAITKATVDGTLDGKTMRRVQTLIDRLQNMDMLEDSTLRGAALALAADANLNTADALQAAAVDVRPGSVRAILLD